MEITDASVESDRAAIATEGARLGRLAASGWDRAVPTCPGWDGGTLLVHTGGAHRWAVANLTTGERVRNSQMAAPPDGRAARQAWYDEGLDALVATAAKVDPEAPVWTFSGSGERRSAWWLRRMAQETGVHRWDAEVASGTEPARFDPAQSAAGIDEYLLDFLPRLPAATFEGWTGTLHLHCTDAQGEWMLDLADVSRPARHEHGRADTAVRGPGTDLLLWLWNRRPPEGLEIYGDTSIVERWRHVTI
jgi:uncharacterized protein (TIGR03083 family)